MARVHQWLATSLQMLLKMVIKTQVFTDVSLITAIANDISYDEIFAEPIKLQMNKNDMLVAISSSGNSKNIIRACEECRNKGGQIITLSAMKRDNLLQSIGDINIYIPAQTYGWAESGHAVVLHYWMDLILSKLDEGNEPIAAKIRPSENVQPPGVETPD